MEDSCSFPKSDPFDEECEDESLGSTRIFSKVWLTDPPQKYVGELLHNNIHGHGFYFIEKKDKVFYDGLFYANKLEGYSQIFYGDGSHYQGLFRDNRRFGPGVLTYPNGEQDVGLWNGYSLATLVIEVEGKIVPKLAHTTAGKLKLLKYRNLVPVCPEKKDIALDTLESLGANKELRNDSYKLYNLQVDNKNNVFFNKKLYDEAFHHNQDCIIDILLTDDELREDNKRIDEEMEEDEERTPDTRDLERIRQISERLNIINCKLERTKQLKADISKKMEYCRSCCQIEQVKEQSESEITPLEIKSIVKGSVHSPQPTTTGDGSNDGTNYNISALSFDYGTDIQVSAIIDVQQEEEEEAESYVSVNDYLYDICICDEAMGIDDLNILEDKLVAVTKDEMFYEAIQKNLKEKLDTHVKKTQETGTNVKTKKVLVNDLLAWNNEELSMAMMKHSFLHRRKEYMVTFQVSNLLTGNRNEFASTGIHERKCIEFLIECCNGEAHTLVEKMRQHNINVNVSDAGGNSGLFFAVASCKVNIISILVNFGAKLDQLNGEGLTPLTLCLLHYLEWKNDVSDWEKSFLPGTILPPEEEKEVRKWYPNKSLLSMTTHSEKENVAGSTANVTITNVTNVTKLGGKSLKPEVKGENYLFDTSFTAYIEPKKKGGKYADKRIYSPDVSEHESTKDDDATKYLIQNTFNTLLDSGADPNFGEVPLPPLLLSVFTKNAGLVIRLLESNANPNVSTDEELTGLHILASLKGNSDNLSIAQVLLKYYCDPNLRCSPDHWKDQKIQLVGKNVTLGRYEDYGKNPLHILCLRRDFPLDHCQFFEDLAALFIEYHINANEIYLGHTPLSIAVLVGNLSLVKTLLEFPDSVDPYLTLGYDMGNVLTLFILKRYEDVLPLETSMAMLKLLVNAYVNPLRSIGQFENAIEFMDKEHEIVKVADKGKKKKGKDKGGKGSKASKGTKSTKKGGKKGSKKTSKKGKGNSQNKLKEYLKELTRDTIIKFVQMEAVENLYNFVEENMLDYDCVKVMAEFLTPTIVLENIQALFKQGKIKVDRFDKDICLKLIEFVDEYKRVVKTKATKGAKGAKKKKGKKEKSSKSSKRAKKHSQLPTPEPEPKPNFSDMINAIDLTVAKNKSPIIQPGLDSRTRYQVCFHCLRKRNKALVHCPRCQLIYFCSDQCNKLNIKLKAQHFCNVNFYKDEKARSEGGVLPEQEDLEELCKVALESCGIRLRARLETERVMREKKLEEEKKLDIYGTKFLKREKAKAEDKHIDGRRMTEVTLYGSRTDTDIMDAGGTQFLKRKLTNLSLFEDKYTNMLVHRHESSLKLYSITRTTESGPTPKVHIKSNENCSCEETDLLSDKELAIKVKSLSTIEKSERKDKRRGSRKSAKEEVLSKFEAMETLPERNPIIRKLRKIPKKYQYFIEMLGNYFPKQDLEFLFLPYACYSNGHLYYKLDEDVFSRTYSMV